MVTPTTSSESRDGEGRSRPRKWFHFSTSSGSLSLPRTQEGEATRSPSGSAAFSPVWAAREGGPTDTARSSFILGALRWILPRIPSVPPSARLRRALWCGSVRESGTRTSATPETHLHSRGSGTRAKRVVLRAQQRQASWSTSPPPPRPICNPLTSYKDLQLFSFIMLRTTN